MRVMTVIGTRPEAIKLAPIILGLQRDPRFESRVLLTGQHVDLVEPVLDVFGVVPDYRLRPVEGHRSLETVVATVLEQIEPILQEEMPDWIVVEGDTASVMAAALAGFFEKEKIAHVEAGLRTSDIHLPFPEELSRRITGMMADYHFAPTAGAAENLRREGVEETTIRVTGNPVIDALRHIRNLDFDPIGTPLEAVPLDKRLVVATMHRRENLDNMRQIAAGLRELAHRHADVQIVIPVHPNPVVQETLRRELSGVPNVSLLPPLDYQPMIWLLAHSYLIITDSGGLQEEGSALARPVLILRDETERPEGLEAGIAKLVGTEPATIVSEAERLLDDPDAYAAMIVATTPYGDGRATERIIETLAGNAAMPPDPSVLARAWRAVEQTAEVPVAELGKLGTRLEEVVLETWNRGVEAEEAIVALVPRRFQPGGANGDPSEAD